jgi:hypothetical protein
MTYYFNYHHNPIAYEFKKCHKPDWLWYQKKSVLRKSPGHIRLTVEIQILWTNSTYIFEIANLTLLESLGVIILSEQNSTFQCESPIGTYLVVSSNLL